MTNNILKLSVLILPVVAMVFLIGFHTVKRESGDEWRIPVTGYDPRDLLSGHYLDFRYDWNWNDKDGDHSCNEDDCRLCLIEKIPGHRYNPEVYTSSPFIHRTCATFIKGHSRYGRFVIGKKNGDGLRRYFIPEVDARHLDRMLRGTRREKSAHKFDVGLVIDSKGNAMIKQMYINDVPLEEWIKQNKRID